MNDFIKAIAYRLYQSFLISPILLYFLSGSLSLAVRYGFVEFFVKILTYYIFEKMWRGVGRCRAFWKELRKRNLPS